MDGLRGVEPLGQGKEVEHALIRFEAPHRLVPCVAAADGPFRDVVGGRDGGVVLEAAQAVPPRCQVGKEASPHQLPHGVSPIIVAVVFSIPRAIYAEAALSYIGIGIEPTTPSWGTMVQEGYQAILAFPHLIPAPALSIAALTLAFTFLGDGLRDALDPRHRW